MGFAELALNLAFYLFAVITVGSAIVVATSTNLIRSAFALLGVLVGAAAMFAIAQADFIAAAQLMIYIGGILVLILFAVMLTHRIQDINVSNPTSSRGMAGIAAILVLFLLGWVAIAYVQNPGAGHGYDFTVPQNIADAEEGIDIEIPQLDDGEEAAPEGPNPYLGVAERKAAEQAEWDRKIGRIEDGSMVELANAGDAERTAPGLTSQLGRMIMDQYLLPFEVLSMLLLGALIGAAYLARKEVREDEGGEA
jgi:NADH:ubiquinone oxidoreductase subunit 6 (subunit J)